MLKNNTAIWIFAFFILCTPLLRAADYFWIGGSGDWSEISHWATSSGGSVTYAQTPTANDNVIFDQNSFSAPGQIITINNGIAFCNSLTFTNISFNPTFRASSGVVLNVYGSVLLSTSMMFDFNGDIILASANNGNTINFINNRAARSLIFNGTGSWTIQNTLMVTERLEIIRGNIDFGVALVTAAYLISDNTNVRNINFQNAYINLTGTSNIINTAWYGDPNNVYTFKINTTNWTSSAGGGILDLDAEVTHLFFGGTGTVTLPAVMISNNNGRTLWINEFQNSNIILNGNLEIRHDANIQSGLVARDFRLSPGKLYELLGGGIFDFRSLIADGDCANLINMLANPAGMPARLNFSEAFIAQFLILRDIHAFGISSIAQNSINLGNNTGWTILEKSNENFYWIGRDGNWNNPMNWSNSSGGTSAGCIPTLADNVIFDNNSFTAPGQFVNIDSDIAYCRDMTWTNIISGAGMAGNENDRIFVNGSLRFSAAMSNEFEGNIFLIGSGNLSINTNNIEIRNNLYLNNPDGNWTLENDIYVQRAVFFISGGVNTGNYSMDLNRFVSDYTTSRNLFLGNSEIYIRDRNFRAGEFYFFTDNLSLDAGTSHLIFGNGGTGVFSIYGGQSVRFHDISFENHQGSLYTSASVFPSLTFYFNNILFRGEGYITGDFNMQILTLSPGNEYILQNGTRISLDRLVANADCTGMVTINTSYYVGREDKPEIEFRSTSMLSGLSLKNIVATGMTPVSVEQSTDNGGNTGFIFSSGRMSRTLYWVGNSGSWFDTQHWSLTSGGLGGECLPTEHDDVIIDENSFNITDGFIDGGNINLPTVFCRTFIFDKDGMNSFYLSFRQINIHGNYRLNYPINNNVSFIVMSGETQDQEIFTSATDLQYLYIRSGRKVSLQSPINIFYLGVYEGVFDSKGHDIIIRGNCVIGNGIDQIKPEIFLRNSSVAISGMSFPFNEALIVFNSAIVHADSSFISLDNTISGFEIRSDNCNFGTIEGVRNNQFNVLTYANTFVRKLILTGNGNFESQLYASEGTFTSDSLILTAGKSYVFQSSRTHLINKYLKARGNNCNPISIRASITDQKSIFQMPITSIVDADFIQIRDIRGVGGADFNAGAYSTNVALSNENWRFPGITSIEATIGFLGPDRFLCPELPTLILDANNFTTDETYLWNTGNTSSNLQVNTPGLYAVTVTFGNNCIVIDTITIFNADNPGTLLPNDTILCNAIQFEINPLIRPLGSSIEWSTGSTADQITVSQTGMYMLNLTSQGCNFRDTITVSFKQTNAFSLGPDQEVCEGQNVLLSVNYPGTNIIWSVGSTQNSITVNNSGTYSVLIEDGPCIIRDTVVVTFNPLPIFSLGSDTSICEGSSIIFTPGISGGLTQWQDGSTSPFFMAENQGTYTATVTQSGCTFSDTITLGLRPLPLFSLGNDTIICEGNVLILNISVPDALVFWHDGSTGTSLIIESSGIYSAFAVLDDCTFEDEINVDVAIISTPDLGRDTIICEGESLSLHVEQNELEYLWNTGSTENSITVSEAGDYFVTVGNGNCTKSDTILVEVAPLPDIFIGDVLILCSGDSVKVNPSGTFDSFSWLDENMPPQRVIYEAGNYEYRAILGDCAQNGEIIIREAPMPMVELGDDFEACIQDSPLLKVSNVDFDKIGWSDGSNQAFINITETGLYSVRVEKLGGCSATDSVFVTILDCAAEVLVFPNIFRPVSSLGNSFFGPVINDDYDVLNFELKVFDRLGNLVYVTEDINKPWDGKYKGSEASSGVYVYMCTLDADGPRKINGARFKGNITLIH